MEHNSDINHMGKSAADLAKDLECNPRTVYRDLEALQVAGFPIYTERVEGKNLWSLLDTLKHQIPIPFSLTELMALYFSRDILRIFEGTVFHDSLESLFQKIRTTLPLESDNYLKNVEQILHVGLKPYKEYGKFKEIINRVNEADIKKKSVEIIYFTMSRKKKSKRPSCYPLASLELSSGPFSDGEFMRNGHSTNSKSPGCHFPSYQASVGL